MNDLDDLIRTSLHAHTPAAGYDGTLADSVKANGRRIRRTRTAGVAALSVIAVAGFGWVSTTFPLTQPGVPAAPSTSQPTPQPTPRQTPSQTPATSGTVRDVSKIGEPMQRDDEKEYLKSDFASPSGNFHCFISTAGAGCSGDSWDPGVAPAQDKVCTDGEPMLGPEVWGRAVAGWECGRDPHSIPLLGGEGGKAVSWWDPAFGESIPYPANPSVKLAVLPYGKTLVAGDFRCSMAEKGVTCRNTRTGHGFLVSRAKVNLKP